MLSRLFTPLSIAILALVAVGCNAPSLQTSGATPSSESVFPTLTPMGSRGTGKAGSPAPDFVLESLSGEKIDSSKLRGHPLLVNFWASWCQPCRDEAPRIENAAKKYRQDGLVVLAITNDSDRGEVTQFVRERNLSFTILLNPDSSVFDAYRVTGIPSSFFVDANGVIRSVVPGPLTTSALETNVNSVLSSTP